MESCQEKAKVPLSSDFYRWDSGWMTHLVSSHRMHPLPEIRDDAFDVMS